MFWSSLRQATRARERQMEVVDYSLANLRKDHVFFGVEWIFGERDQIYNPYFCQSVSVAPLDKHAC